MFASYQRCLCKYFLPKPNLTSKVLRCPHLNTKISLTKKVNDKIRMSHKYFFTRDEKFVASFFHVHIACERTPGWI